MLRKLIPASPGVLEYPASKHPNRRCQPKREWPRLAGNMDPPMIIDALCIGSLVVNACRQTVKNLGHCVRDCLTKRIACLSYLLLLHVPCSNGESRSLFRDDLARSFNCPLSKIRSIVDGNSFHGAHQIGCRECVS